MGVVRVTWPVFFNFGPNDIFGIGEAKHFKFRVLPDTDEYWCTHGRLTPKGMCSGSRDLLKFWERSSTISETVQDRHIVAIEE